MSADRGRTVGVVVCCTAVLWGAVACSDSSTGASGGDKSAFCTSMGELRPLLRSTTADGFPAMLRSNHDKVNALATTAPGEVKGDTQQLITVVGKAVDDPEHLNPFQNPKSNLNKALARIDSFCGVDPATVVSVTRSDVGITGGTGSSTGSSS